MEKKLDAKYIETIRLFQSMYSESMLTGTCALILYGFDLQREPKDIDFILPSISVIPNDWKEFKMPDDFKAKGYWLTLNSIRVEVIIWNEYSPLLIDGIKITSIYDLIDAKLDLGLTGTMKHIKDFHQMLTQLFIEKGFTND